MVVMLTDATRSIRNPNEPSVSAALNSNLSFIQMFGFDAKTLDEFAAGVVQLTPMQKKVLMYLIKGNFNKEIAYACNLSTATIKAHATKIYEKLKTKTRGETAVKFAVYLLMSD